MRPHHRRTGPLRRNLSGHPGARRGSALLILLALTAGGCLPTPVKAPSAPSHPAPGKPAVTAHAVTASRPTGTNRWRLRHPARNNQIEGFTTHSSALSGQPVVLKVSTYAPAYRVNAYRIGWYVGGTGHQVWRSRRLPGVLQAAARFSDAGTHTIIAPWHRSLTVPTHGWRPGLYVFKLTASSGLAAQVPYVVSSRNARGKVALVAPVATWQAYNDWGGYSNYVGPAGQPASNAVSFNRPYPPPGAGDMNFGVVPVVIAAERWHLPLAYYTDIDLARRPNALTGASAYVSMGHDEYWTQTMRNRVAEARQDGTNLAFLGANTMFWRVRLTKADRLMTAYRTDPGLDPALTRHPSKAAGEFRGPAIAQPESLVTGMDYQCYPVDAPYRVVSPTWWGFAHTHVHSGTEFKNLVGIEADHVNPGPDTPKHLQVLSDASYSCNGQATTAQSVYYTSSSGAGVFNAGTLRWTCALDNGRCNIYRLDRRTVRFVRHVTHTVLGTFAHGPAAWLQPAHTNAAQFP